MVNSSTTMEKGLHNEEKSVASISKSGKTEQIHVKINEIRTPYANINWK